MAPEKKKRVKRIFRQDSLTFSAVSTTRLLRSLMSAATFCHGPAQVSKASAAARRALRMLLRWLLKTQAKRLRTTVSRLSAFS